ncbi:MAG: cyclase [Chloroflexota bacterium]|jgi:quinol monooxygenase YgiN
MVRMFARHQVADYGAWRKVYDSFERETLGVRQHAVYRNVADPNDITVWHDFDDRATAEAFAGSDELKAAMTEAGVVSAPNIWITDEA